MAPTCNTKTAVDKEPVIPTNAYRRGFGICFSEH